MVFSSREKYLILIDETHQNLVEVTDDAHIVEHLYQQAIDALLDSLTGNKEHVIGPGDWQRHMHRWAPRPAGCLNHNL